MQMGNGMVHAATCSVPKGQILLRALKSDPVQEYLLYVPERAEPGAPLLVSIHGVSSNSRQHMARLSGLADRSGAVVLVPVLTKEGHPDYQRLGRRGTRADLVLQSLVQEAASLSGADGTQIHLFGFSGGAQFAHRYVMAHPHRVARAVVAASGWYTFPDSTQRFPYGIRPVSTLRGVAFDPEQFHRVPVRVLIGEKDVGTSRLRRTERTVAQQGENRLDRARNWVTAMRHSATSFGLEPVVSLEEVGGVDHSFTSFCESGDLVDRIGRFMFPELDRDQPQLDVSRGRTSDGGEAR